MSWAVCCGLRACFRLWTGPWVPGSLPLTPGSLRDFPGLGGSRPRFSREGPDPISRLRNRNLATVPDSHIGVQTWPQFYFWYSLWLVHTTVADLHVRSFIRSFIHSFIVGVPSAASPLLGLPVFISLSPEAGALNTCSAPVAPAAWRGSEGTCSDWNQSARWPTPYWII